MRLSNKPMKLTVAFGARACGRAPCSLPLPNRRLERLSLRKRVFSGLQLSRGPR